MTVQELENEEDNVLFLAKIILVLDYFGLIYNEKSIGNRQHQVTLLYFRIQLPPRWTMRGLKTILKHQV